ncbi:MAG: hypothetical protein A3E85_03050 [Gammaproteobacteria bacterium RIFCSPHIGHO2_12_FULL_45_12]|nr:MAG: hypothetical protein A3E85_03050 [Gammaproteobacteria bacterium RIFCSPHIGHO2_12_FULL_45_12]
MKLRIPFKVAGITALLLVVGGAAWAIVGVGQLPGSVQPGPVSNALTPERPESSEAAPSITEPTQQAAQPLGEQAKKIKFQLNKIVLKGNHVYTDQQLSLLYQDKLHKVISIADLMDIAVSITNYYRNTGYIISRAILPPQHVKNGVVEIQIIEGYLDKVTVGGHPKGAKCIVMAYGQQIIKCRPLKIDRMEHYLFLANELPGTQVKAVLVPSKTEPGAADLTLITENRPVTGYLSYDNYGTRYIGPQQMTANLGLNSFASAGDTTQVTVVRTPKGGELNFTDINYTLPISDEGVTWLMGATRVHTHPLFVLQPSQVDGLNDNYYTNFQFPIIRERDQRLTWQAGFFYVDSIVNQLDELFYADHIRSLDLGLIYNFADRWSGVNLIVADFRQGLPILGYTSNQNPDTAQTSRPGALGDYTKVTLLMNRLQAVKGPVSLYGVFKGQWAFNPVLSSEQFTFGGSQLGRGYDVAEVIGDKGLAGSVELRYDWNVSRFLIQTLQLYTFYDAGMMWDYKQIPGTPSHQSATSFGVGTRFSLNKYISGNVMWAQPLTKPVAAEQATSSIIINGLTYYTASGMAPRVFFSIVASLD